MNCTLCNAPSASIEIYDDDEPTGDYICNDCLKNDDGYKTCDFCGDGIAHSENQINLNGKCSTHKAESSMSEDERIGWEHNIRKWNEG